MSKLKALITTLVLGSSSLAMAQPSNYSFRTTQRPVVVNPPTREVARFDDRSESRFHTLEPRHYRTSWVSLTEPIQLTRGRGRIDVNLRGTFTQLRVQTAAGSSYIQRIVVTFADGGRQVIEVNQALDPSNRMLQFMLDGNNRRIDRVAVAGSSRRNAAIQVFGI
jgi:hypothetical protein